MTTDNVSAPAMPNESTIERLVEVASVIEESAHFNMSDWLDTVTSARHCCTSGCVAGHAAWHFGSETARRRMLLSPHLAQYFAVDYLGLKPHEADWLFRGHFWRDEDGEIAATSDERMRYVTGAQAARACRALAEEIAARPERTPPAFISTWIAVP